MCKVSIVAVAWDNKQDLDIFLKSLENIDYPSGDLSFILGDNGSTDGSFEKIRNWKSEIEGRFEVEIFRNETNLGFSSGYNQAIKRALEAGAEYVVLLNCDTEVGPNFLQETIKAFQSNGHAGIIQSLLLRFNDKSQVQSFGDALHYLGFGYCVGDQNDLAKYQDKMVTQPIGYASLTASTIKKEVFEEVGLLDERYVSYHEDTDLSLRARLQGYEILLQPNSRVYHNHKFPMAKNRDKAKLRYFWMERNRFLTFLKFYKLPTLILLLPAFLFMELGQIYFSLFNGFSLTRLKVYRWLIMNPAQIWQARKETREIRKFGDRYLMERMVGKIEFQAVDNFLLKYIGNPILNLYFKIIKLLVRW